MSALLRALLRALYVAGCVLAAAWLVAMVLVLAGVIG
jgi:hypothetical protein